MPLTMRIAIDFDAKPHTEPWYSDGSVTSDDGNSKFAELPIGKALIGLAPFQTYGAALFLRRQRHVEAVGQARRLHQLLGLGDVLHALRYRFVGGGEGWREWAVIAGGRHAAAETVDQLGAVDRRRQRLAHAQVGERVLRQIGRASLGKECRSRWSPYH